MRKCKFEDLIDNYLLNRLDEDKKKIFEEHYFSCPYCFEKMVERDELISIIKYKGDMIFQDGYVVEEAKGMTWVEKIVSFLTPKQWVAAAVSACLFLIIGCLFLYVIPNRGPTLPLFSITDDSTERGTQIKIKVIPSKIEWSILGEDVEYKIYIYNNGDKLWSATTKENFIILPDEVKRRMILGEIYSCEVKAFSPYGPLKATGRTEFKIQKTE
ncbi:hypothetical protein LCGC14_0531910 [marine sediment metagenome]|uniref:Zinc-finger domain-containing protein n=1 Tax=marine sediment metagenome TaxID=412755 RepID=A0A0F9V3H1_9ZZZZ|nr:zf-HC2 domain-containing protein [Candidatus Aminicenantes bacterium]HEB36499.1 zf-HC2 domain-containing protein [Candidatus Aminicenantes bacterium]